MDHDFQCKKGRLIFAHHNDMADEWDALCTAALTPKYVSHKPLINYGGWSSMGKSRYQEETRVGGEWGEEREDMTEGLGWLVVVGYGEAQVGIPADVKIMHRAKKRCTTSGAVARPAYTCTLVCCQHYYSSALHTFLHWCGGRTDRPRGGSRTMMCHS